MEERVEKDSSSSSDDSDNEVVMNRRGVIPREWFEDQEMQGYDQDAQKIVRAKQASRLEEFV